MKIVVVILKNRSEHQYRATVNITNYRCWYLLRVPITVYQHMFHRTTLCMNIQSTMMTSYGRKSAMIKKHSSNCKSMLSWDATFLFVALLIRALFLFSLTPWFVSVRSFEVKHSGITSISNKIGMKSSSFICSTMTDCFATTEAARKRLTNDEILNGASKTTQLLLQKPPDQNCRQTNFHETRQISAPTKVKTLYEILGTVPTATKKELKRKYLLMAKLTHPDALISQQKNECTLHMFPDFTEVVDAYQILSNPLERKKYDRTLHSTQVIEMLVLLGDICIGTTLTVAEITTTIVWVTLMVILQPVAIQVSTELFYLSTGIDESGSHA